MFGWYPIVPNNFWGWKNPKPFLHLSLSKAGPFTLESHICVKAWRSNLFQITEKPWMAELLNNMNVWMVLYCAQQFSGLKKNKNPFSTFLWVKLVHLLYNICDKALKCKVFQITRCLIKPLLKNSTQTIFQGGTPWVAELLNNMNVWMVLYCAQQLLGLKKNKNPWK